jgi:hypothetical protein
LPKIQSSFCLLLTDGGEKSAARLIPYEIEDDLHRGCPLFPYQPDTPPFVSGRFRRITKWFRGAGPQVNDDNFAASAHGVATPAGVIRACWK